ncbi:energy-coupling factor transporter transmembrane component T, partial [Eubacterium aggregans]|uniref:energy-coupling factor transporter transmembrane component T n=1 Tax=Eubacterium aggregans TaxID=81409 RepID=UPI003F392D1B
INFFYFVVVLLFSMCFNHPALLIISLVGAVVYTLVLLGVRSSIKFNLVGMLPMLFLVALINPLFNHGGVTILGYWPTGNTMTLESIVDGAVMAIMFIEVIVWFACCNTIMTSDKFICLFERVIPALSLILSMVLCFVPKFKAQMHIITQVQRCIGRDIGSVNVWQRARNAINILSIMVTWALENAIDTADSMKARGYGLKGRTSFSIFRFDSRDRLVGGIMLALFIIVSAGIFGGLAYASYNPIIKYSAFTPLSISCYALYLVFCLMPVIVDLAEAIKWKKMKESATNIRNEEQPWQYSTSKI